MKPRPTRPGPSRSTVIRTIAGEEITRLVRDRTALFFIVVLPVVIIVIIGATMGAAPRHTVVGVVDADHSTSSSKLIAELGHDDLLDVRRYSDTATLARDIRSRLISGGLVVPAGYGDAGSASPQVTLTLLLDRTQSGSVGVATIVGNVVGQEGARRGAAEFVTREVGGTREENLAAVDEVRGRLSQVEVRTETTGRATLDTDNRYAYTAPSNLVLFTFINSVTGAAALVESRRLGVTRRVLAGPVRLTSLMSGLGLSRLLIALLQSLLILGVGRILFGVGWGDPLAVAVLVLVFSVLASAAGLLISTLARTTEQVVALGIPVSIGLAMLGGCMWPLEVVPTGIRALGHLTPHAWAMDAWVSLIFEDGNLATIATPLTVLTASAAVLVALSTWRMRHVLTT